MTVTSKQRTDYIINGHLSSPVMIILVVVKKRSFILLFSVFVIEKCTDIKVAESWSLVLLARLLVSLFSSFISFELGYFGARRVGSLSEHWWCLFAFFSSSRKRYHHYMLAVLVLLLLFTEIIPLDTEQQNIEITGIIRWRAMRIARCAVKHTTQKTNKQLNGLLQTNTT